MRLSTEAVCRAHAHDLEDCEPDGGSCPCHRPQGSKPCQVPVLTESNRNAAGICWVESRIGIGWTDMVTCIMLYQVVSLTYDYTVLSIHKAVLVLCYQTWGAGRAEHLATLGKARRPTWQGRFLTPTWLWKLIARGFQRTADSEDEVWAARTRGTAAFSSLRC